MTIKMTKNEVIDLIKIRLELLKDFPSVRTDGNWEERQSKVYDVLDPIISLVEELLPEVYINVGVK